MLYNALRCIDRIGNPTYFAPQRRERSVVIALFDIRIYSLTLALSRRERGLLWNREAQNAMEARVRHPHAALCIDGDARSQAECIGGIAVIAPDLE